MVRRTYKSREMTIADAVSYAYGEIEGLAEEIRGVVDNTEGTGLRNTSRIETLDETASTLENVSEPDVPAHLAETKVTFPEIVGKNISRRSRLDNAIAAMDAVIEATQENADDEKDTEDHRDDAQSLLDELEGNKDEVDGVELPGMYG